MEMNEHEYQIFKELLQEGLRLSEENNISLTDALLLRQLTVLQGLFTVAVKLKSNM